MVPLVLATVVGLVVLWPGDTPVPDPLNASTELVDGTVIEVSPAPCPGVAEDGLTCEEATIELHGGPRPGSVVGIEVPVGAASPEVNRGDKVVLGYTPDAPPQAQYYLADFQRDRPLLLLGLLFAVAVVALGRFRGLRALVALAASLLILVKFVLPSILEGHSPVLVSVVGAAAVMLVVLYATDGVNVRASVAALGTMASLALIVLLSAIFVAATHLTGLASEEATYLRAVAEQINLEGLLLGGIVIGSLGVLDDMTVTQVSAVWELHLANPTLGARRLYRAAERIGRDHIASTVNTLVLAYAGASMPLLILFTQTEIGLGRVVTGELVATEIVRTLVGSVGLVASVPITTGLAAFVVTRDR